jgi:hypothetical protein
MTDAAKREEISSPAPQKIRANRIAKEKNGRVPQQKTTRALAIANVKETVAAAQS